MNNLDFINIDDKEQKAKVCIDILSSLPDWFENNDAVIEYSLGVKDSKFIIAKDNSAAKTEAKDIKGFISIRRTSDIAYEIYVMAVKAEYHGAGTGKRLVLAAEKYAFDKGAKYLLVKTLSDKSTDECYRKTREFYLNCGFEKLEELDGLWDEENPCLNMIKQITELKRMRASAGLDS